MDAETTQQTGFALYWLHYHKTFSDDFIRSVRRRSVVPLYVGISTLYSWANLFQTTWQQQKKLLLKKELPKKPQLRKVPLKKVPLKKQQLKKVLLKKLPLKNEPLKKLPLKKAELKKQLRKKEENNYHLFETYISPGSPGLFLLPQSVKKQNCIFIPLSYFAFHDLYLFLWTIMQ